jgi:4,5-DOPA dioxygenase extradiol
MKVRQLVMYPVIFIGHGSPINAIEDNEFTRGWIQIAKSFPKPKAILCISAHWVTKGTHVSNVKEPKTISDFYGFPRALYEIDYKAKGSPQLANRTFQLIKGSSLDDSWGLDHGAWSVLKIMYPEADVEVYQLSLDHYATEAELYEYGKLLKELRNDVLIIGSGNIVHNLRLANFDNQEPFPWTLTFDNYIYDNIMARNHQAIINYQDLKEVSQKAVPTTEHFNPLFFILGASNENDEIIVYNKQSFARSLTMTSYVFSPK